MRTHMRCDVLRRAMRPMSQSAWQSQVQAMGQRQRLPCVASARRPLALPGEDGLRHAMQELLRLSGLLDGQILSFPEQRRSCYRSVKGSMIEGLAKGRQSESSGRREILGSR